MWETRQLQAEASCTIPRLPRPQLWGHQRGAGPYPLHLIPSKAPRPMEGLKPHRVPPAPGAQLQDSWAAPVCLGATPSARRGVTGPMRARAPRTDTAHRD